MKKLISVFTILLLVSACTRVDTNEVAVYRNAWTGNYSANHVASGMEHAFFRSWTTYSLMQQQFPPNERSESVKVLSNDNLEVQIEAAYTWQVIADSARYLRLNHGDMGVLQELTYKAFRAALRDAGASFEAMEILSLGREALQERVKARMDESLNPEGIQVPLFFVRDIQPPQRISEAIQNKLAAEQQVEEQRFLVQVEEQKANQRRARAEGIRDEQNTIAESLLGQRGQRFLQWRYFEVIQSMADGQNNTVVVPVTESGVPVILDGTQQ